MGSLAVWMRRANGLERLTRENHVGGDAISAEKATGIAAGQYLTELGALYGRRLKDRLDERGVVGRLIVGREVRKYLWLTREGS